MWNWVLGVDLAKEIGPYTSLRNVFDNFSATMSFRSDFHVNCVVQLYPTNWNHVIHLAQRDLVFL